MLLKGLLTSLRSRVGHLLIGSGQKFLALRVLVMRVFLCVAIALTPICGVNSALAQSFSGSTLVPSNGAFNGRGPTGTPFATDQVLINRVGPDGSPRTSTLPLGDFASSADVQALRSQWAYMASRDLKRSSENAALSAAITILAPNPGDRFAFTFSGAASDSHAAGSLSASYRLTDSALGFVAYSRSETQNLFKAGVSLSVR